MMFHSAVFSEPEIDRWCLYLNELALIADRAAFLRHTKKRRERLIEMRQILERAERHLDEIERLQLSSP